MVTSTSTDQLMGRARSRASSSLAALPTMGSWRAPAPFAPCGTTGLFTGVTTAPNHTVDANGPTIERPTRHLGRGST